MVDLEIRLTYKRPITAILSETMTLIKFLPSQHDDEGLSVPVDLKQEDLWVDLILDIVSEKGFLF